MTDVKSTSDRVEDLETSPKDNPNTLAGRMPEFLRGLSTEERDEMEKKLVRKVDIRLLIMIVVMYILNYLDRNNIASAKLAGLEKDLDMHGDQYLVSWPDF